MGSKTGGVNCGVMATERPEPFRSGAQRGHGAGVSQRDRQAEEHDTVHATRPGVIGGGLSARTARS